MSEPSLTVLVRLALATLALSAVACSSSTPDPTAAEDHPDSGPIQGSNSDAGTDSAAPSALALECEPLSNSAKEAACGACIQTECTATCAACANDKDCLKLWNAITVNCVDDAGVTSIACGNQQGAPYILETSVVTEFSNLAQSITGTPGCIATHCATPCPTGA